MKKKYINLDGPSEVQVSNDDNETEIHLSYQKLRLVKMFGPTIFADLRIQADYERMEWIIERHSNGEWKEWTTVPAQLDSDFTDPADLIPKQQ